MLVWCLFVGLLGVCSVFGLCLFCVCVLFVSRLRGSRWVRVRFVFGFCLLCVCFVRCVVVVCLFRTPPSVFPHVAHLHRNAMTTSCCKLRFGCCLLGVCVAFRWWFVSVCFALCRSFGVVACLFGVCLVARFYCLRCVCFGVVLLLVLFFVVWVRCVRCFAAVCFFRSSAPFPVTQLVSNTMGTSFCNCGVCWCLLGVWFGVVWSMLVRCALFVCLFFAWCVFSVCWGVVGVCVVFAWPLFWCLFCVWLVRVWCLFVVRLVCLGALLVSDLCLVGACCVFVWAFVCSLCVVACRLLGCVVRVACCVFGGLLVFGGRVLDVFMVRVSPCVAFRLLCFCLFGVCFVFVRCLFCGCLAFFSLRVRCLFGVCFVCVLFVCCLFGPRFGPC